MGIWLQGHEVWDSPVFTGIPVAPTAAVNTATTQLATTAFVDNSYFRSDCSRGFSGAAGSWLFLTANNSFIQLRGGTTDVGSGSIITCYGSDHANTSLMEFRTINAAKSASIAVMQIAGNTDTPYLDMLSHRIAAVLEPTTAGDALRYNAWTAWTPSLTWTTATPAAGATTARYYRVGKTIFFEFYFFSGDSNGTTNLTFTLPSTPSNVAARIVFASSERYGAAGTTFTTPIAEYLADGTSSAVYFRSFQTASDGQPISVSVAGMYEIT